VALSGPDTRHEQFLTCPQVYEVDKDIMVVYASDADYIAVFVFQGTAGDNYARGTTMYSQWT